MSDHLPAHARTDLYTLTSLNLSGTGRMTMLDNTHHLAGRLLDSLRCAHPAVFLQLLRLLADGRPMSVERIATTLHTTSDEVTIALEQLSNVEFDAAGNIVAAGLSLTPTLHRVHVSHQMLFTWCALATVLFPVLLGQVAQVASPCPVTGATIRLTVTGVCVATEQRVVINAIVSPDPLFRCYSCDSFARNRYSSSGDERQGCEP